MNLGRWFLFALVAFGCGRCPSAQAPVEDAGSAAAAVAEDKGLTLANAMTPRLLAGRDSLWLTWLEPLASGDGGTASAHRLRVQRLRDGRWSEPVTIVEGDEVVANWADFPSLAEAADGTLVAQWPKKHGAGEWHAYDVALALSSDGGKTWRQLGLAHDDGTATEHGFVSMVPEGKGSVRAFWLDGRHSSGAHGKGHVGAMTLRTALIGGDGSLSAGEQLDGRVCDCCQTSAAVTSSGPVIAFRDRSKDEVRDIGVIRRGADKWESTLVNPDGWKIPGCPVNGPRLGAEGSRVAIAWYTYAAARPSVRVAFSEDGGASFGKPIEVDGPRERAAPVGRVDLQLVGGEAIVSWLTGQREDSKVVARRVAADGRLGDTLTLAASSAERQSGFPRTALHGDALWLAYTRMGQPSSVEVTRVPLSAIPAAKVAGAEQAQGSGEGPAEGLPLGSAMPAFSATSLEGSPVKLASDGKATLVNLWATWCEPCRVELPELSRLAKDFGPRGLEVVGVSVDAERSREEVARFVASRKLGYEIWHDPQDRASTVFASPQLPSSFLFDRSGKLVWKRLGAIPPGAAELEAEIERALRAGTKK